MKAWLVGAALGIALAAGGARADDAASEEGAVEEILADASEDTAQPDASAKPDAWAALGDDLRVRKVVVVGFDGKGALRLRQAVLDALSAHSEIEIVGSKDIEISGKSRGLSPNEPSDRQALSEELGIYAWVLHEEGGAIALVDAQGDKLTELRAGDHGGSEADLRAKVWSTLGPHVSDQGLREHLLARLRASAEGKLAAAEEESARQLELALRRQERRAAHLAMSKQRAQSQLEAQRALVVEQQQLAIARVERAQQEAAQQAELSRQAELARQQQLAQQAEDARKAELAQQMEVARQAELSRQRQLAQPAMAKDPAPQPSYDGYPEDGAGAWQPGRTQPVFAAPAQPQPAYAEPQPAYVPQPAPDNVEPAPSTAMPISPETQAWLERRRAQQQQR